VSGTFTALFGITLASAALAAVGFLLVVRLAPGVRSADRNEVGAVYFSLVGVLYAILLAFVVVVAWEKFTGADSATATEVTRLSNLWRDAGGLEPADRDAVRADLARYVEDVIAHEFGTMADGEPSGAAGRSYAGVWDRYYELAPRGVRAEAFYATSLGRLNELGEARRLRLLASRSSIPLAMWGLLVGGGILTIGWCCLFWMRSTRFQAALIAILGGFAGFVLFLIYALQHPFAGDVAVSPQVYQDLLGSWRAVAARSG
jgi:Protein of unknown function (DUF4239)